MSTKSTIAYSKHVHLYEELLETDCVFLELLGPLACFECMPGRITVAIPKWLAKQLGMPIECAAKYQKIEEDL